jgi:hypothetical protein
MAHQSKDGTMVDNDGLSINAEADKIINGQRREDYGSADESFRKIATGWEVIFGTTLSPHQVVQAMVWLKVCRSLQGYQRDSYVDICGYAGLAEVLHEAEVSHSATFTRDIINTHEESTTDDRAGAGDVLVQQPAQ